jgi:hypothetical protein
LVKILIGGGTAAVLGAGANCQLFGREKMAKQDVDFQKAYRCALPAAYSTRRYRVKSSKALLARTVGAKATRWWIDGLPVLNLGTITGPDRRSHHVALTVRAADVADDMLQIGRPDDDRWPRLPSLALSQLRRRERLSVKRSIFQRLPSFGGEVDDD